MCSHMCSHLVSYLLFSEKESSVWWGHALILTCNDCSGYGVTVWSNYNWKTEVYIGWSLTKSICIERMIVDQTNNVRQCTRPMSLALCNANHELSLYLSVSRKPQLLHISLPHQKEVKSLTTTKVYCYDAPNFFHNPKPYFYLFIYFCNNIMAKAKFTFWSEEKWTG